MKTANAEALRSLKNVEASLSSFFFRDTLSPFVRWAPRDGFSSPPTNPCLQRASNKKCSADRDLLKKEKVRTTALLFSYLLLSPPTTQHSTVLTDCL